MALKLYAHKHSRPCISVTPSLILWLNATACRLVVEAGIHAVFVLWDPMERRLVLRPAEKGAPDSYRITFNRSNSGAQICAVGFLKHIKWSAEARETVIATWDAAEKSIEATVPAKFLHGSQARAAE